MDTKDMTVRIEDREIAAERLREAAAALRERNYLKEPTSNGELMDMVTSCILGKRLDTVPTMAEYDQRLFELLARFVEPVKSETLLEVTLIPTVIEWKDDPGHRVECTFSLEDTEGLDVDGCVTFSGMSPQELSSLIGKDFGEDFNVLEVGKPYKVSCRPAH